MPHDLAPGARGDTTQGQRSGGLQNSTNLARLRAKLAGLPYEEQQNQLQGDGELQSGAPDGESSGQGAPLAPPDVTEPGDGLARVHGRTLGPFAGDFNGRSRASVIEERLLTVDAGALARAELVIQGSTYRIQVGEVQFQITHADLGLNATAFPETANRYRAVASHFLTQLGAPVPEISLADERGEAAAKSAQLEFERGGAQHGEGNSWETAGSNKGPLVNEYKQANNAGGNNTSWEWCGMFVGYNYMKAGIRTEILQNLVFWSAPRLERFFESGGYVATSQAQAGDWWQSHQTLDVGGLTGETRKAQLDAFQPRAGDVALFGTDREHVGIVVSYDSATGNLELMEGNLGNRVQATAYGTGSDEVSFLGRFNDSDYQPNGEVDADLTSAAQPNVTHGAGGGSTH